MHIWFRAMGELEIAKVFVSENFDCCLSLLGEFYRAYILIVACMHAINFIFLY
mgnify:CR=1 FL=1